MFDFYLLISLYSCDFIRCGCLGFGCLCACWFDFCCLIDGVYGGVGCLRRLFVCLLYLFSD